MAYCMATFEQLSGDEHEQASFRVGAVALLPPTVQAPNRSPEVDQRILLARCISELADSHGATIGLGMKPVTSQEKAFK